jgi:hypothetical protein
MDDHQAGGMPGEANVYPWLERLLGRSLADVRVHDSGQAGALAARLGARAFAAGRHIYVRPDLLRPLTPQGVALLAHELTHAVEQSDAPAIAAPAMPLLTAPPAGPAAGGTQRGEDSTAHGGGPSPPRLPPWPARGPRPTRAPRPSTRRPWPTASIAGLLTSCAPTASGMPAAGSISRKTGQRCQILRNTRARTPASTSG